MGVYNYIDATGTIVPDTANTRTNVVTEFREIFGQDFITDPETPEGQWIDAEVTSRQSVARNNANMANQINPDLAGGLFLDAILAFSGNQRRQESRSRTNTTITGTPGTIILAGSRARTTGGDVFRAVDAVIIPSSGTLTDVTFQAERPGPIEAAINALSVIVENILGWDTITNPAAATLGALVHSDNEARIVRRVDLALQARATPAAVIANVSAVAGVQSLAFRENITGATAIIDGITLVEHSVWVAVSGGSNRDIALALLESKTAGANWNGSVTESITDPTSNQAYTVRFDRPTTTNVLIRVTIRDLNSIDSPFTAVRQSILRYAAGQISGEEGFTVGRDVSPFEIAAAVNNESPSLFVTLCEVAVKVQTPTYSSNTLAIPLNQIAAIETETDITIVVGTGS